MTILNLQVAADADDGWEDNVWHGSSAHWWGITGSFDENGGYRFTGVTIPQGATIDAAYLSFWVRNSPNSGIHMRMYGDDVDDAAVWSGSDKPSGITQTTAVVVVEPSTDGWAADQFNNTREAKAVIQEIVDRAGWVSGNAMRFAVINNSSSAEQNFVSDYTNDTAQAAKLHVEYTEASGTDYTLTAAQGSYTLTGQDTAFPVGHTIAAAQGGYTLTGQDTAFVVARIMAAGQGSYTLTGQDAELLGGKILIATQGGYSLTGQSATLTVARIMAAAHGGYVLTGRSTTLRWSGEGAPARRTFTVAAESRTFTVAAESRTFEVA